MLRDRLKQESNADERIARERKRGELSPPVVRSPALESAERLERQAQQTEKRTQRPLPSAQKKAAPRNAKMSYAVEDTLVRPQTPRKSLPTPKNRLDTEKSRTGLTANWRRHATPTPAIPDTPLEVINEEEKKKLAALEMRLPRIAGKFDAWLLIIVLMLLCLGLVMIYSASSFLAERSYGDPSYFFQKQLIWGLLGIVVMLVTMRIDYRQWRRVSLPGMIIVLPLLVIVLIVGTSAYGASRWLGFGSFFSFQPSELIKLVLAFYVADWLARKGKQVGTFLYGLAPFVLLVGLILGLVLLENDMGTAIIIAALATAMFFTAGANIIQFILAMGCGGLIFLTQAFHGYRYYRLMGFLDPFKNVTTINLQLYQSLLALGSGGWFGLGLGASRQKTGYLPFPYIDSIFAIVGEELGFIGSAIIVLLFLFLAFRGFRLARRSQDIYGALLATGITTWLIIQAIINIGSSTGTLPYTGVPLPFITYGGSSLVITMAAIGVLLNISRYIQKPEDPALSTHTITKSIKRKA